MNRARNMLEAMSENRTAEWDRILRERVGEPLRPETLQSVAVIIPGNSGDVALATSVVHYIKARNAQCRVIFKVKRSNLPLIRMCPGVDESVELRPIPATETPSRQRFLAEHSGTADAVIYPICINEDVDLLRQYNFLETIWLLSGVPDGVPKTRMALWLSPPSDPEIIANVLRRSFSEEFAAELAAEARRLPGKLLGQLLHERKFRDIGWKHPLRLRQHASYIRKSFAHNKPLNPLNAQTQVVIVSSDSNAAPRPPKGLFEKIIRYLKSQGRIVLHNVLNPASAAPGTIPLVCSYAEFLSLRAAGIPFVGWRSGLCDIAAASPAPMCVLYPRSMAGFAADLRANCDSPIKSFGFASMNVAANCLELVCDSAADLDPQELASVLG